MTERYKAGTVTYNGDLSHIVDEVKGPTTYGSYVIATDAVYDRDTNSTRVTFHHLTEEEDAQLQAMLAHGSRM